MMAHLDEGVGDQESNPVTLSESESEYLCTRNLGRIATSSPSGQPHVVPVVYEFDGKYIYFGGWNLTKSLKYRTILGNPRVAFVVDDIASISPWRPRGVEIEGEAEALSERGCAYVRITIISKRSWGL